MDAFSCTAVAYVSSSKQTVFNGISYHSGIRGQTSSKGRICDGLWAPASCSPINYLAEWMLRSIIQWFQMASRLLSTSRLMRMPLGNFLLANYGKARMCALWVTIQTLNHSEVLCLLEVIYMFGRMVASDEFLAISTIPLFFSQSGNNYDDPNKVSPIDV